MTKELLNKIIKYLMSRPYSEVFELMDEIRDEVKRLNAECNSAPPEEDDKWQS